MRQKAEILSLEDKLAEARQLDYALQARATALTTSCYGPLFSSSLAPALPYGAGPYASGAWPYGGGYAGGYHIPFRAAPVATVPVAMPIPTVPYASHQVQPVYQGAVQPAEVLAERRRCLQGAGLDGADRLFRLWAEDIADRRGVRVHAMDTSSFSRRHVDLGDGTIQRMFDVYCSRREHHSSGRGDAGHDEVLHEFLLRLLDEAYFELSVDGLDVDLRLPDEVRPLRTVPDLIVLDGQPCSTSPLSKQWIRERILASREQVHTSRSASQSRSQGPGEGEHRRSHKGSAGRAAAAVAASAAAALAAIDAAEFLYAAPRERPASARRGPSRPSSAPQHGGGERGDRAALQGSSSSRPSSAARGGSGEYSAAPVAPSRPRSRPTSARAQGSTASAASAGAGARGASRPQSARASLERTRICWPRDQPEVPPPLVPHLQDAQTVRRQRSQADAVLQVPPSAGWAPPRPPQSMPHAQVAPVAPRIGRPPSSRSSAPARGGRQSVEGRPAGTSEGVPEASEAAWMWLAEAPCIPSPPRSHGGDLDFQMSMSIDCGSSGSLIWAPAASGGGGSSCSRAGSREREGDEAYASGRRAFDTDAVAAQERHTENRCADRPRACISSGIRRAASPPMARLAAYALEEGVSLAAVELAAPLAASMAVQEPRASTPPSRRRGPAH